MKHPIQKILEKRKTGERVGIYSACSAHPYVLQAVIKRAKETNSVAVIESTTNQVNQFGGYTGMLPADFADMVKTIVKKNDFPMERLILGGDHLGPLIWTNEEAESAMKKSEELIRQYVMAGYTKIHIDTSMKLASDSKHDMLKTEVIAERGARLCAVAVEAYETLKQQNPNVTQPVYIIGSEVPIPGGIQSDDGLHVTTPTDFQETVNSFKAAFDKHHIAKAWENIVGVVVETGVEFGDNTIYEYQPEKVQNLVATLKSYPNLCFEGHSTDYQTKYHLKRMVADGIAILKVGPALTFAMREALFALENIEKNVITDSGQWSNLTQVLEAEMLKEPKYWENHYKGNEDIQKLARKYSYSDRIRYYMSHESVESSIKVLEGNINRGNISLTLLSQFMPEQYKKVRANALKPLFGDLVIDKIADCIDDYIYAIQDEAN